jgi:general L-amino acid transport system substrate-binding protein
VVDQKSIKGEGLERMFKPGLVITAIMATLPGMQQTQAGTLENVKARGNVQCGINQGLPGFATRDDKGMWQGLDVDFCRAVAAAVFGDAEKVKYTPLSAKERISSLQSGDVDVLSRNTTWTSSRDIALGLSFVGTIFYDGQGFMVRADAGVNSAKDLAGATICANSGTTTELNVADFFQQLGQKYDLVTFEKSDEALRAYQKGRCDAYTTDHSGLSAQRLKLEKPDEHIILPQTISKEPLGPVVREADVHWFKIIRWTLFAIINAEELGLSSGNIDQMKNVKNPKIRRFVGLEGDFGVKMKLDNKWAYNIVKQVGNYGEIFERNVGPKTALNIAREKNALWTRGGLHYAPPMR